MLKLQLLNYKFFRFVNSGLYFDFFLKKISEIVARNVFIYSSLFFGEKFMIEVLTKKIIDNFIYFSNTKVFKNSLNFDYFFYQLLLLVMYFFFFFNLLYFF